MRMPYMQFWISDWINDTRVLTLEERGAWIDILTFLWKSKPRGQATMTNSHWSNLFGILPEKLNFIVTELKRKGVAEVQVSHNDVTVMSRRILRDEKKRQSDVERK